MTNPPEDNRVADGAAYTDAHLRRLLHEQEKPESQTARLVRLRATTVEAYTQVHSVYEELRESGHAYAWSTAYAASGMTGILMTELGELLDERTPPTQEPTHPTPPCQSTQHCASWGWCHRCDPQAAQATRHIVKAVEAIGVPADAAGLVYAATMETLRRYRTGLDSLPTPGPEEDPCPGK